MLAPHVAQSNSPANQRRKTSAGHLTGFFSAGSREGAARSPWRALSRRETAAGEPPVCMAARADSLHDFLTRVAAFLIAIGEFKACFVRDILVVVILSNHAVPDSKRIELRASIRGQPAVRSDAGANSCHSTLSCSRATTTRRRGMPHPGVRTMRIGIEPSFAFDWPPQAGRMSTFATRNRSAARGPRRSSVPWKASSLRVVIHDYEFVERGKCDRAPSVRECQNPAPASAKVSTSGECALRR